MPVIWCFMKTIAGSFHGGKKYVGHLAFLWSLNGCRSRRYSVDKNSKTTSLTSFIVHCSRTRTCFTIFSSVSVVDFEQVNASWVCQFNLSLSANCLRDTWKVLS